MTDVPRRPQQHRLATAATRAFESALPEEWVAAPHGEDTEYGIDRDVEIFEGGSTTGRSFYVQLKGTASSPGDGAPRVSIKRTTWNYWRQTEMPVLLVLWVADTDDLWIKWTHRHDDSRSDTESKTLSINFDERWGANSASRVHAEVRAWRAWNHAIDLLPLPMSVTADNGSVSSVPCSRVAAAIRRLALKNPKVLRLNRNDQDDLYFTVDVAPGHTTTWISGGPSATVHHDRFVQAAPEEIDEDYLADTIASAVFVCLANRVASLSALGPAARLASTALEYGTIGDPQMAGDLIVLLFDGGRFAEAMRTVKEFYFSGSSQLAEAAFTALLYAATMRLDDDERLAISAEVEQWADEQFALDDPDEVAGVLAYNAASFSGRADPERTLRLLEKAAEIETTYEARGYWHRERGGILFHLGRLDEAANAYTTAVGLGDWAARGVLADALYHLGRYSESLAAFEDTLEPELDTPEWRLKRHLLRWLSDKYGIGEQVRDRQAAERAASTAEDPAALTNILIGVDLLCGFAHWKLGHNAVTNDAPSFEHWLVAAFDQPDRPRAWLNALMRAMAEQPELGPDVIETAYRLAGHEILDMLMTSNDPEEHELARHLQAVFEAIEDSTGAPVVELRQAGPAHEGLQSTFLDFSRPPPEEA